jgi:hypothetical protein
MARKLYYSSVDEVIKYTGVEYDKLGLGSKPELEELILKWLKEVASLINANRNRDMITDLTFGDKVMIDYGVELWNAISVKGVKVIIDTNKDKFPDLDIFAINKIEIDSTVAGGTVIAGRDINPLIQNFSDAKILMIKVKPYNNVLAGNMQLILYGGEESETVLKAIDFPKMGADEWKLCRFYLGCDDDLKEIKRIGIKIIKPIGSYLWISDIQKLIIPEGITNIAMRACANMVKLAYANRESPVIRIEELDAKLLKDEVLTDPLKKELRQYWAKPSFRFMRVESPNND